MGKVKVTTLFLIALLLYFSQSTFAARPDPVFLNDSMAHKGSDQAEQHAEVVEESCEGVGEEECLMRRTLAAHIDYIYTQKHKP